MLLIVIVFTAATSLALFVQAKQADLQERDRLDTMRELERIEILDVDVVESAMGDTWDTMNFTVVDFHFAESRVTDLQLGDQRLENVTLWRRAPGGTVSNETVDFSLGDTMVLQAREQVAIEVDLTRTHWGQNPDNDTESPLAMRIYTEFGNRFDRTYLVPSAIPIVTTESQWNATNTSYEEFLILDGTQSDHPDPASRIVSYEWTVTDPSTGESKHSGRKVRFDPDQSGVYTITLRVVDDHGLYHERSVKFSN